MQSSPSVSQFQVNVGSVLEEDLAVNRGCLSMRQRSARDTNLHHFGVCVTGCQMQSSPSINQFQFNVGTVVEENLSMDVEADDEACFVDLPLLPWRVLFQPPDAKESL